MQVLYIFLLLTEKSNYTANGIVSFSKIILPHGKAIRKIYNVQLVHSFKNLS